METIILTYKPIFGVDVAHTKTLSGTPELIAGITLMSRQLAFPDRFIIQPTVDVSPYVATEIRFPYQARLRDQSVQFGSVDFIQGAIYTCLLLGHNWPDHITDLQANGQPWPLQTDFYLNLGRMMNRA